MTEDHVAGVISAHVPKGVFWKKSCRIGEKDGYLSFFRSGIMDDGIMGLNDASKNQYSKFVILNLRV
jgi:hypothetical protein